MVRDLHTGAAAAKFFSTLMLVMGLAPILAPLLGGQVLAVVSWHGIFVVQAAFGLALMAVTVRALPETHPPERRHKGGLAETARVLRGLFRDRLFMGYAATAGLAFAAMFAYIAGSPFVLQRIFGMSPQHFAMVFGANAFGLIGASQVNGRLVERLGPRRLTLFGLSVVAVACLGVLASVALNLGLAPLLASLFLAVAAQGLVAPNSAALALAEHGRVAGAAAALLGTLRFVVGAAAAPLVGLAGETSALPMAVVMALCGVGGLLVCVRIKR
jgi:DHA1 family bicyclomycin/chloramphenicol resistance-like MFS transporter